MIKISIDYKVINNKNRVSSLLVKGHADSAPRGQDLICAAVSAIVTGGANAISQYDKDGRYYQIELKDGYASFKKNDPEKENEFENVIETIIIMLSTVAEADPKFVKIEEN